MRLSVRDLPAHNSTYQPSVMMTTTNGSTSGDFETEVLVIGGGFGGMYAIYKVRQLGLQAKLIEAGADFGGVWHWNRYPGARVDSETPFYQLSIPEVYNTWNWKERFPGHEEIRQYFKHVDETLGIRKDAIFNTIVEGVSYKDGFWSAKTKDGRVVKCKYLILATGSSYKKHYPNFKDLDKFKGEMIHSAIFPAGEFDVKGKRVAVIGNGATGVQITQELAKQDCELTVYIRTPNIALPMKQRKLTVEEQETTKQFYNTLFQAGKNSRPGFPYNITTTSIWQASEEEREGKFEELWARGGFSWLLANYRDFAGDKKANALFYNFWAKKVRARIKDPSKADIVAPLEQEQFVGTKRPSLEQDYYEAIDRDNVHLVNLVKSPIVKFNQTGIETTDGLREFDTIILATGYDAMTGSLMDLHISDKDGVELQQKWKEGVYTYLGLMINGMPNMFMVYSPQAPTALSNGPPIIEIQVDWIVDALKKMREEGIGAIDPQFTSADKWRSDIQAMNQQTLYPLANSWYMGANIPGKVREQLVYLGGVDTYNKVTREAMENWTGFDVVKA